MNTAALEAAAWGALSEAWAWRWALIIGVGSFPKLLPRVSVLLVGRRLELPVLFRQACALVAVLLCLHSLNLAADTYLVESQDPDAYVSELCGRLSNTVTCTQGGSFEDTGADGAVKVWRLPRSGLVLLVQDHRS